MRNYLSTRWGIIFTGAVIGVIAVTLQKLGNPANMGICVACFERDMAGSLGLHRAEVVQYMRPEIAGLVLGSFLVALVKKEYQPRGGSSTIIRFFLGVFAMIGALVFLGCPWRALLRFSGGDWNAIAGLLGLAIGIAIGVAFLKNGYNLGRSYKLKKSAGWVFPAFMAALVIMVALNFRVSETGPLFFSKRTWFSACTSYYKHYSRDYYRILAQRSRFCTMGSIRDIILEGLPSRKRSHSSCDKCFCI